MVAFDYRTIAEYEPPAFRAPFLRHRGKQEIGRLITEREQRQLTATI